MNRQEYYIRTEQIAKWYLKASFKVQSLFALKNLRFKVLALCVLFSLSQSTVLNAQNADAVIILKMDDVRFTQNNGYSYDDNWKRFADSIRAYNINAGLGVILNGLAGATQPTKDTLKDWHQSHYFELWHHGWDHAKNNFPSANNNNGEFSETPYSYQKQHFEDGMSSAFNELDIVLRTFGAPFNQIDNTTLTVMQENSDVKVWLFRDDDSNYDGMSLERSGSGSIEPSVGVASFSKFLTTYNGNTKPYLVLQGHPRPWDNNSFAEFEQIVNYLKDRNHEFILPYDYYRRINGAALKVSEDAHVQGGTAGNTNFNGSQGLVVKNGQSQNNDYDRKSYLKFDLSTMPNSVSSARLRLKSRGNTSSANSHSISAVSDDSWSDNTITWNNSPVPSQVLEKRVLPDGDQFWIEYDITGYVNDELNGDRILSLALEETSINTYISYYSEESIYQPEILYLPTPESTQDLHPSNDAFVWDGANADNNYNNASLVVKDSGPGYDRISYLKIDMSSFTSDVSNATLKLKVKDLSVNSNSSSFYLVSDDSWDEGVITWNNRPALGALIATQPVPNVGEWIEVGITNEVNNELTGDDILTLAIFDLNWNEYTAYHSTEASSDQDHPVMTYTYNSGSGNRSSGDEDSESFESYPVESQIVFRHFPNPVTGNKMQFEFSLENDGKALIQIFEVNGKLIYQKSKELKKGNQNIEVLKNDLEVKGNTTYLYRVTTSEFVYNGKIIN